MRTAFIETLFHLAKKDKRIILITGDLGYSVFENFRDSYPNQYLNAGVAEQNMTGVAAGLAIEGFRPVIYSIAPFATMRNFEMIRNDICYQNLDVKVVGLGAGFSYGPYGHTHHGLEDIGILRMLPNMNILTPGDPIEAKLATIAAFKTKNPCYIRLGRAGEPIIHTKKPDFRLGKGIIIQKGKDIALIATSTMLKTSIDVAESLMRKKIKATVISIPTIKPLDEDLILTIFKNHKFIYSIEEHFKIGGLGSAISEVIASAALSNFERFHIFAVPDHFTKVIGMQEFMREANGLSSWQIEKKILNDFHTSAKNRL